MKKQSAKQPDSGIHVRIGGNATANAIGNGASVKSNIIAGGNVDTSGELDKLFAQIDQAVSARKDDPRIDKEELIEAIDRLKAAIQADQIPDEPLIKRRLRVIAGMAPDILDVIIETFKSPFAGIGAVVRKIAQRIKEEAQA